MKIKLYSTHCPKCKILEEKMKNKNIKYELIDSVEKIQEKGIMTVPVLEYNGEYLDFLKANNLINSL